MWPSGLYVVAERRDNYLGIRKPTVLRVPPRNYGVRTYYFVGFGDTGKASTSNPSLRTL